MVVSLLWISLFRYLIFNTAMSKTWGFPQPCPPGCKCNCHDCRVEKCLCGIPQDMCSNFPASFLIDYVRVYQKQRWVLIYLCFRLVDNLLDFMIFCALASLMYVTVVHNMM